MRSFIFVLLLFIGIQIHAQELEIRINSVQEIHWSFEDKKGQYSTQSDSEKIQSTLQYARNCLIYHIAPDPALMEDLFFQLFEPIQSQIDEAGSINFIVAQELRNFPFDLATSANGPLFLQKEILYSLKSIEQKPFKLSKNLKGVIVRDSTADPQNGCEMVYKLYQDSEFLNLFESEVSDLSENSSDFLLLSAHGIINTPEKDHIRYNGEQLLPEYLSKTKARLIYFDSCDLGVSESFLTQFEQAGVQYYIAPIVKNEAGNSSTLTMKYFFEALERGDSPVRALFLSRSKVFNEFKELGVKDMLLWYSFPFRVYRLN